MARSAISRHLSELLGPVVAATGADLEEVTVTAAGRRSVVRVVADRDGGLDLDAVADISRAVSDALDADDALGESPYVLEVSSPGVDRPLTEPRHWRRALGRRVTVTVDGAPTAGRITSVDDGGVSLDGAAPIGFTLLGPGRIEVEFSRPDASDDELDGDLDDEVLDDEVDDDADVDGLEGR